MQIFAHISSYFQFLWWKYGAKPFGTLRPATYTLWKYVCGSFAYLYCHGRQKKNEKSLSYHFHSNVTQKVMNDAQREIKGMWCYFKEIYISLKSRLWCTESVFYIGQVLPRNTAISEFSRRRTGKEMACLGEIEKRERHYSIIIKDSDEVTKGPNGAVSAGYVWLKQSYPCKVP